MDSPTALTREGLEQALERSPFAQLIGFSLTGFAPGASRWRCGRATS